MSINIYNNTRKIPVVDVVAARNKLLHPAITVRYKLVPKSATQFTADLQTVRKPTKRDDARTLALLNQGLLRDAQ